MDPYSTAWITEVSGEVIQASWGDVTFLWGRSYGVSGRVLGYSTDRTGSIETVVKGSGRKAYRMSPHYSYRGINSACSYPMRMGCKHAMVVPLAARGPTMKAVSPAFSWENVPAGLLSITEIEGRSVELGLEFQIDDPLEWPNGLVLCPLRFGEQGWVKSRAGWLGIVTNYRKVDYEPTQHETLLQMTRLMGCHQYIHSTPVSVSLFDLGPLG